MSRYQTFIFEGYHFDITTKQLALHYSYDDELHFSEHFGFDFSYVDYDPKVLDRAMRNLFLLAGVSYYKAFLAPRISAPDLSQQLASFLKETYQQGLGEFFYVNQLDPTQSIDFPYTDGATETLLQPNSDGLLIGLGGGKDSLVTVEALRDSGTVATWSVGHRAQLQPLVDRIGLPHFWVERTWDPQLLTLNDASAYNGHVPISAILAAAGNVVAVLTGYRDVVVSNEHSANEATLEYRGRSINHQYSKSEAFETAYQQLLASQFGDGLRYYSFLRPLSELKIAELFAANGLEKYAEVFSSCNRAFRHDSQSLSWCGECPKCAFVYLALANFVDETKLMDIFGGRNLLQQPALQPLYRQLLGISGDKPLECVGEIRESRYAMRQLQSKYPELTAYQFDLPADYDYKTLYSHQMPPELFSRLTQLVA